MDKERVAGWLSGSCLLVRWDAFCRIGGFDERYFTVHGGRGFRRSVWRAGFTNVLCPTAQITHAVGHSAGKHPESMLPAHHESAYRFQGGQTSALVAGPYSRNVMDWAKDPISGCGGLY